MRVLLAILDAGGGHRSAARAVAAALAETTPEWQVAIEDVGRGAPVPLVGDAPAAYRLLLDSPVRPFFDVGWRSVDRPALARGLVDLFYPASRGHLRRLVERLEPDLVVGLHAGLAQCFLRLREETGCSYRVATVVTDIVTVHALWASPESEVSFAPTEEAARRLRRLGVPAERIEECGFPIHPDFARAAAHIRVRPAAELDLPRVLLMGGGSGAGGLARTLAGLERVTRPLLIEVVTGNNRRLYEALRRRTYRHTVEVHGFVTEMARLMSACDVVVSKAGPGSLMEAWSLHRPTLVGAAVGPQERGNLEWGARRGLAWPAGGPQRVGRSLTALLDLWDSVGAGMQPIEVEGAHHIARRLVAMMDSPRR